MKGFFNYFFGVGAEPEFTNFSPAHILPIVLMIGIILLIYRYREQIRTSKHERTFCFTMAFIMIVSEMSYFWRLVGVPSLNPNPEEHLPITVCGWTIVFCSYLVLTKSQTLFDISYFWLFSGTIFALITPTVIEFTGPTRFRYYQFWIEHTMGYISIFYMIFVHKMRPNLKSIVKSYAALAVLAGIAYFANEVLGGEANYLFMAATEDASSIVNMLPSNILVRILLMGAIVTVLFAIAYLPWFIKDRRAKAVKQVKSV